MADLIEQAEALAENGDFSEAIALLDRAAETAIGARKVRCFGMKGAMLSTVGRNAEAARAYAAILEIDPEHGKAWYSLGCALQAVGDHARALEAYTAATRFRPGDPDAWINRGVMHDELGGHRDAMAAYDRALALDDRDPMPWSNRGNSARSLGLFEDARRCYDRALQLTPGDAALRARRNTTLVYEGRLAEANAARTGDRGTDPGEAREQTKANLVARYHVGEHSHPHLLDREVAKMLSLVAACRDRAPGIADGTRIRYGWSDLVLRARGDQLVLCELDFARDPTIHLREEVSFTAMGMLQILVTLASIDRTAGSPDTDSATYLDTVVSTPNALDHPDVVLARTADGWELRADDSPPAEHFPLYLFARHRPHLLKAVWLPLGWRASFHRHRLVEVTDERGAVRLADS